MFISVLILWVMVGAQFIEDESMHSNVINQSAGEEKYLLLNQYLIIFSTAFLSTFRLL